jgi:uncharacterized membrane protein
MKAINEHFEHHPLHMLGCAVAVVLVVVAIVFKIPILAVFGALMCGAMMVAMVWMMVSMSSKHRH